MNATQTDYIVSLQADLAAAEHRAQMAARFVGERAIQQQENILDIGCGLGQTLLRLSALGYQNLYGLDNSAQAVQQLGEKMPAAQISLLDIERQSMPYPDNFFKAVICMEVFEHLYHPPAVLAEISRVLAPGGYAIFSFPNEYRLTQRLKFLAGRSISSPLKPGGHIKLFNQSLVKEFVGQRLHILSLYPEGNRRIRQFPWLIQAFPALLAKWFFVVAQKQ